MTDFDTFCMDEGVDDVPGATDPGAPRVDRPEPGDDTADGLPDRLDALPPEDRTAWLLYLALKIKEEADRRFAAQAGDPATVPPETAQAIRRKLDEVVVHARDAVARNPPGPETLRRIEEGLLSTAGGAVRR